MNLNLIKKYFLNLAGIIFSRISGLGRDFAVTAFLGASVYSDMFFIMLRLPLIFRALITEGVFNQAFLPHLKIHHQKGIFAASVFCKMLILCALIGVFVNIFAPWLAKLLAPGLAAKELAECVKLIRISIWFLLFIFIASFLSSLLNYEQKFFLPSVLNAIFNIVCMLTLPLCIYFSAPKALEITACAISLGAIIQAFIAFFAIKNSRLFKVFLASFRQKNLFNKSRTKGFFKSFSASALAASSSSLGSIFEFAIASSYMNAAISYIQLSTRLYQLPLALIAIALSQVLLPAILSKSASASSLKICFWLQLIALSFAACVGYFFADFIIRLLFMRGAFGIEQVHECANILRSYIFCIIPLGLSKIFLSQLAAKLKQVRAAIISAISVAINCLAIWLLLPHFGLAAFGIAATISASFLLCGYALAAGRLASLFILSRKFLAFIVLAAILLGFWAYF